LELETASRTEPQVSTAEQNDSHKPDTMPSVLTGRLMESDGRTLSRYS